jgi:hypothetical protein
MSSTKKPSDRHAALRKRRVNALVRQIYRLEWCLEDLGITPDLAPGSDRLADCGDILLEALQAIRAEQRRRD